MKAIAKKELSRDVENGIETVKYRRIEFELDENIHDDMDEIFDDVEYACDHGILRDRDESIAFIEVDGVIEELQNRIDCDDTPDKEDSDREIEIIKQIEPYRGFTLVL